MNKVFWVTLAAIAVIIIAAGCGGAESEPVPVRSLSTPGYEPTGPILHFSLLEDADKVLDGNQSKVQIRASGFGANDPHITTPIFKILKDDKLITSFKYEGSEDDCQREDLVDLFDELYDHDLTIEIDGEPYYVQHMEREREDFFWLELKAWADAPYTP